MKRCSCCQKIKPNKAFNFKNRKKQKRNSFCAECHKVYCRNHYQKNKKYYKQKARRWDAKQIKINLDRLGEYFVNHPCVDCGEQDTVVLEFDHVFGKKQSDISSAVYSPWPWDRILEEI